VRFRVAFFLLLLAPATALAQSAEIQQTITDAAAKYNLPQNVLSDLIRGESSFNPNIGCNSSGACGIAQFIPGTAAQYGVNVNDATSSINGAANYLSDLRNQTGSLSTALTRYSGGCTPLAPCNAAYAQAFQDAQNAGLGNITVGDGSTLTGPAAPATTAAPAVPTGTSALSRPFQWAWDKIMTQAQDNTADVLGKVQQIAYIPLIPILALVGIVWGVRFWAGRMDYGDVLIALITMGIVAALVIPGSDWYSRWVNFVEGLPSYFASNIGTMDAAGPAGVFDSVWLAFWIKVAYVWNNSPWEKVLLTGLLLFFVVADIVLMLVSMFFTFLMANFILFILLATGPIFILGLLFPGTHGFFRFWIDLVVAILLYLLVLDVMLSFFITVMNQLIDSVGAGTTPWTDMLPNLLGAVIIFSVMGGVNAFLALQFGKINAVSSAAISKGWSNAGAGFRAAKAIT